MVCRPSASGTLEPVDVAPHEAGIETLWAFDIRTTLVPMSGIAGIYLRVGDGGNRQEETFSLDAS